MDCAGKTLVDFFIENKTSNYCVLDRRSDKTTVSVAATGFGYYAWAVAEEVLGHRTVVDWIRKSISHIMSKMPAKNRGWLYHFIDPEGNPKFNEEVSSIDTAIFWLGARRAANKLKDPELKVEIEEQIKKIDIQWMQTNNGQQPEKKLLSHGLFWEGDEPIFIGINWDCYNEGWLLYKLFNISFTPQRTEYSLPLFVYYYLTCFYPEEKLFQDNLRAAVLWQINNYGYCGVTACDGPNGYSVNDPNVISPLSVWACSSIKEAADFLGKIPHDKTTPAYCRYGTWSASDRIGIDDGSCLMMITT